MHTKDIPEDVLNTYCWIHSTYTLKSLFKKKAGEQIPYPGVGNSEGKEIDRKVYKYYQWVCFCLFFQVSHVAVNCSSVYVLLPQSIRVVHVFNWLHFDQQQNRPGQAGKALSQLGLLLLRFTQSHEEVIVSC